MRAVEWLLALALAAAAGALFPAVLRLVLPVPRRAHVAAALVAPALVAWGALLAKARPFVHEPRMATLAAGWILLALLLPLALRLAAARPSRAAAAAPRVAFAALLAPLFLFYPTVYRYGAPAAMAPVWMIGLLAIAAFAPPSRRGLVALGAALLALFPFKLAEASDFRFLAWISWPVQSLPGAWTSLDLAALLLVFVRRQRPVAVALAVAAAVLIYGLHIGEIGFGKDDVFVAAGLFALAALLRLLHRRGRAARAPDAELVLVSAVERTLALSALLVGFHALVLTRVSVYAQADVLLAAVGLSAPFVERLPERAARWAFAGLGLLAVLAAGWVGVAWTVHTFEWSCLYDWFSGAFVERHIGWILPLILARYLLPGRAARRLLFEGAPSVGPGAEGRLFALVGAKAASLVLIMLGIGLVEATSDAYLEAAQEAAIWLVVMGGVV